jgi:hypothetical protein
VKWTIYVVTRSSVLALTWRCKVIGFVQGKITAVSSLLFDGIRLGENLTL